MAGTKALSEANMISLIREVLHGKDLSQLTPRAVREEVISRLGDKETSDHAALKAAVKSALNIVLKDEINEEDIDAVKPTAQEKGDNDSEQPDSASTPDADKDVDATGEAELDNDYGYSPDEEEENEAVPRKRIERTEGKVQQRPKKRARAAVEENGIFKSEKDLERLKKVCRRLGCVAPPSRYKGSTIREKCSNLLSYLRSKGVMDSDPTRLKKEELDAHRKRLDREKDLEGLDVSNIIEEEGRPKRRRAAAKTLQSEELPSDLSGPELSEKSEDDGEEFAVSDADSE